MKTLDLVINMICGTLSNLRAYARDREARQRGTCWITKTPTAARSRVRSPFTGQIEQRQINTAMR
jgi:hypothetical protein